MSHRTLVLTMLGLAALSGCGGEGTPFGEPVSSTDEPIMGGTDDSGDHNVVDIVWMQSGGYAECSGSLLAPNMVLTAHHCVATLQNTVNGGVDCSTTDFAAPDAASNFFVSTDEFLSMNLGDYHTVRQVVIPPNSTNTKLCGVDQAILILSDNVDASVAVPLIPRVDTQLAAKEAYTAIGFGGTVQDGTGAGTRRKLGGLFVNCVGTPCESIAPGQIDTGHEWIGDHGTCEGDSGGPALDQYNRVVGVTSRGGAYCSMPLYGDVYAWASWIKATALTAAQLGGYTAPPWATGYPTDPAYSDPVGGACGSATTCPSNICLEDSGGSYCSRVCETAAPCPSGYTCETVNNLQVCQRPPPATQPSTSSGVLFTPSAKSGCNIAAADPTKPIPWFVGTGMLGLVLAFRSRRSRWGTR